MKRRITKLIGLLILLLSTNLTNAQTTIDNEPTNNQVPGDLLTLPANNNAALSSSSDVDVFKVAVTSGGVLIINITGTNANMKSRVEVINPDGTTSEGYRDATFASADVSIEILTQVTGNYFIKVSNAISSVNSSNYNLSVTLDLSDTYEFNNTIPSLSSATAISLSLDENSPNTIQGKIQGFYRDNACGSCNQFANLAADEDIYKITTNSNQGAIIMKIENAPSNLKFRIEVINANGTYSEGYRDANLIGDSLRFELLTQYAGIYYIKVSNINGSANGSGNTNSQPYTLKLSLDTIGTEYNNTPASLSTVPALSLSLNENNPNILQGKIRGFYRDNTCGSCNQFANLAADFDIYKVTTNSQQGAIIMKIENAPSNLKFRIEVINANGTYSEGYRDANVNGDSLRLEVLTQYAGVYYIKVSNANGIANGSGNTSSQPYTLKLSLDTIGSEYNNTPASLSTVTALSLSLDENNPNILQGKIRGFYRDNTCGSCNQFANLAADFDIYKVTTNSQQGAIIMKIENAPSNLKFRIEVINTDGVTSEGYRDANLNGDSLRLEVLTQYAGIYYIKVSNINGNANGSGNTSSLPYTLKLSLDTIIGENNNSPTTAYTINFNQNINGKIRGHYRTNSCGSCNQFVNLSPDIDFYRPDSCGSFSYARLFNVPANLKLKITAYSFNGTTVVGTKTATLNGDTVRLNLSDLTGTATYFKVESVNSGNTANTSPYTYTLFLGYSPYANITSTFDSVCVGMATNFTSAPNIVNNWSWNFGSNSTPTGSSLQNPTGIIFNSIGQQQVVLSANGCSSDTLIINVNPTTPTPTILANGFLLTSSSLTGNQWYFNNNPISSATNQNYTVTQSGTYKVCVSIPSSCGNPCSDTLAFTSVSINEVNFESLISVFPNPTSSNFTITFPETTRQIQISNSIGQVLESKIVSGQKSLSFELSVDGIYILQIITDKQIATKKLIVSH